MPDVCAVVRRKRGNLFLLERSERPDRFVVSPARVSEQRSCCVLEVIVRELLQQFIVF